MNKLKNCESSSEQHVGGYDYILGPNGIQGKLKLFWVSSLKINLSRCQFFSIWSTGPIQFQSKSQQVMLWLLINWLWTFLKPKSRVANTISKEKNSQWANTTRLQDLLCSYNSEENVSLVEKKIDRLLELNREHRIRPLIKELRYCTGKEIVISTNDPGTTEHHCANENKSR